MESRIEFKLGTLLQIESETNKIEFENDQSINYKISYDILVICTGASHYSELWKGNEKDSDTKRVKIANAQSVLVVGAGITGVEIAANLAEKQVPQLVKVGLCCRGDRLLPEI